jgi:heme-degrading monooxygenase HmoA
MINSWNSSDTHAHTHTHTKATVIKRYDFFAHSVQPTYVFRMIIRTISDHFSKQH